MTHRPAMPTSLDAEVECPFCGSEVGAELVTYGGTCPKCFAEIPGDEAPTDPGVEVRAAQDRRDRARRMLPVVLGMTFLIAFVSCTGVTALTFALWPEPEVAQMLDFDALDFPMPEIVEGTDAMMAAADPAAAAGGGTASPAPASSGGGGTSLSPEERAARFAGGAPIATSSGSPKLSGDPVAAAGPTTRTRSGTAEPARPAGLDGGTSPVARPTGLDGFSLASPKARRDDNLVLTDPDAIRDMIGERMVEFIPGLKVCYDRRLKVMPSLKGRWLLTYQVEKDGSVSNAQAKGLDKGDAELEQCLASHIQSHWSFGKISRAQPVSKTVRFTPPGM